MKPWSSLIWHEKYCKNYDFHYFHRFFIDCLFFFWFSIILMDFLPIFIDFLWFLMNFNGMIFMLFIEFLRFLWIFYDSNGFSIDVHWFSMVFYEFQWIFIDFSSILIIFKRLGGRIFIDFAWKALQKHWNFHWWKDFHWFSLKFLRFLWIFYDVNGFSIIFSVIFYGFSWISMDFHRCFIDFYNF